MKNKVLIVNFSLRDNSQSHKVGEYLKKQWGKNAVHLDYIKLDIPMWDESVGKPTSKWLVGYQALQEKLKEADGYIFVVPEYNGTASPAFSNFNLMLGVESNHKAALIVTVSASRGGAYPVSNLRAFGSKNNKINFIPEHIIVRDANDMLKANVVGLTLDDQYLRSRIEYTLDILNYYITASRYVREKIVFEPKFGNGM
jgi:NAD(P)H-dependent FMN reductase